MRKPGGSFGSAWEIVDGPDAFRRGAIESDFASLESGISQLLLKNARVMDRKEMWVEIPLGNDGEWTAACRLLPQNGVPVVAELRVFPCFPTKHSNGRWGEEFAGIRATVPPGGISTRLLRQVRLSVSRAVWKDFRQKMEALSGDHHWFKSQHGLAINSEQEPKREYFRGRPDSFYAQVARRYCKLLESGVKNPIQIIAESMREPPSKVRDMILQSRKRGMLTYPPKQGRIGGLLTPKAHALLRRRTRLKKTSQAKQKGKGR